METVDVLVVVSIDGSMVLARLPGATALRLHDAGTRLAARLSEARERAILGGGALRVDLSDRLPDGVLLESLDVGGTRGATSLELRPEGDALPARATLADESGARITVVLPAGFPSARLQETPWQRQSVTAG